MLASVSKLIPRLLEAKHKGEAGRIGIVGGCEEYTGAPYFSGITCLKQGADLVHIFCEESAAVVIKSYSPDLIVHPYIHTEEHSKKRGSSVEDSVQRVGKFLGRLHALVVGPGLGKDSHVLATAERIVVEAKALGIPLVFDADGLFLVQTKPELIAGYKNVFLTPNMIEFERLCRQLNVPFKKEEAKGHPDAIKKVLGSMGDVTIVLKGQKDLIADRQSSLTYDEAGSPRRCGGQGDILSGSLAIFAAWAEMYRQDHKTDALDGVSLNVLAGYGACAVAKQAGKLAFTRLGRSFTASDVIPELHPTFTALFPSNQ